MSTHWALRLVHFLYIASVTFTAWVRRRKWRPPKPLQAQRSKIPEHLCLNLVAPDDMPTEQAEDTFLQCIQDVAAWCRALGIERLTVYDRHGVLYACSDHVHRHVFLVDETSEDSCESEVQHPLTPPLSESSTSRSHSPDHAMPPMDFNVITMKHPFRLRKRRDVAVRRRSKSVSSASDHLILHIVSRASGKPAIVSATRSLLQYYVSGEPTSDDMMPSRYPHHDLTASKLSMMLEAGLPPPDLMIIHHISSMEVPYSPIEFHGFPPWQNSLTEFHRSHPDDSHFHSSCSELFGTSFVSEAAFCRALDEYSGAEFRLGR